MSKVLGPYPLSVTMAPLQVSWEQTPQPPIGIELQNNSGLLLEAQIGGQPKWLLPWSARFLVVPPNSTSLTVLVQEDITPTTSDPLTLSAELYQVGDNAPTQTDRALPSMAAASEITIQSETLLQSGVSNTIVANGGSWTTPNVIIPSGVLAVAVYAQLATGSGNPCLISVESTPNPYGGYGQFHGLQSGASLRSLGGPIGIDVISGSISSFTFKSFDTAAVTVQYWIVGYTLPKSMVADAQWFEPFSGSNVASPTGNQNLPYNPKADGPKAYAFATQLAGTATLLSIPAETTCRIYTLTWSAYTSLLTQNNVVLGTININGQVFKRIFLVEVDSPLNDGTITFEGGLPIYGGAAGITIQIATPAGVEIAATIAYSFDC